LKTDVKRSGVWTRHLLPSLTAGAIIAIVDTIFEISLAALLFAGPLSGHISQGIGLLLFGAMSMNVIVALSSSLPGMIAIPQDTTVAVMALVVAAIAAAMPASASSEAIYWAVVATIVLTSVATGLFFLILGNLRLGRLVRYVPYPVIGGFLAGTGWLIVQGGLSFLTGGLPPIAQAGSLFQADLLGLWLPASIFAVLLLVVLRRVHHPLAMPALLLAAVAVFYVWLDLMGVSLEQAREQGWLLGSIPGGVLWQPFPIAAIASINWQAISGQALQIGAILIISVLALLFNVSGLEMTVRRDIDLDRELRAAGAANLLAGLGGSPVGYQTLSLSALSHRIGAASRLVGLFTAVFIGAFIFLGASILPFIPKVAVGGLLLYLGLSFLAEWVYDAWFTLPRGDYVLVMLILVIISAAGFLEGIAAGMGIAVALFVVNYSRIHIIKHAFSGAHYHSSVDRPQEQSDYLRQNGEQILILELQGFIFFGTAHGILLRVKERAADSSLLRLRYVILDLRQVYGLDSSAVSSFIRLKQLAEGENLHLVFSDVHAPIQDNLVRAGLGQGRDDRVTFQPSMDYGLEYCEELILREAGLPGEPARQPLHTQLAIAFPEREDFERLMIYLHRKEFEPGEAVLRQGEPSDGLYILEDGKLSVQIELEDGKHVRLRTAQSGTLVGEIGLYLGGERTASVLALQPSTLYHLSALAFQTMLENEPDLAAALHRWIAGLLAERLSDNARTIRALMR